MIRLSKKKILIIKEYSINKRVNFLNTYLCYCMLATAYIKIFYLVPSIALIVYTLCRDSDPCALLAVAPSVRMKSPPFCQIYVGVEIGDYFVTEVLCSLMGFYVMVEFYFVAMIMYKEKHLSIPELYYIAQNNNSKSKQVQKFENMITCVYATYKLLYGILFFIPLSAAFVFRILDQFYVINDQQVLSTFEYHFSKMMICSTIWQTFSSVCLYL
jgi:hypothetical protein